MRKYKIAFVCTGNSCRSQMAEGWAKAIGGNVFESYSAGTHPMAQVNPFAIAVMQEAGIDISSHWPKNLDELPSGIDILITMGCGVECPYLPANHREDWRLEDPFGQPIEMVREIRDIIKGKMLELIEKVQSGEIQP